MTEHHESAASSRGERPSDDLLPCPFCGNAPVIFDANSQLAGCSAFHVTCSECRATLPVARERDEAVRRWNRRAVSPASEATTETDSAWPPRDVVAILVQATDHLLNDHDCDHDGYERVMAARDAARAHLSPGTGTTDGQASTRRLDLLETAWGLIANASGGNWERESSEWRDAAARFCEAYHAELNAQPSSPPGSGTATDDTKRTDRRLAKFGPVLHTPREPKAGDRCANCGQPYERHGNEFGDTAATCPDRSGMGFESATPLPASGESK